MDRYTFAESKILKSQKLIIDTSSLMELLALSAFVDTYSHILKEKKIIILPSVYSELLKHKASADEQKQALASSALQYIQAQSQYFILPETLSCCINSFADADILEYLLSARKDYVILLITQDRYLAIDAMSMNSISSCYGRKIFACRVDSYGFFQTFTSDFSHQSIESNVIRVIDTERHEEQKDAHLPQQEPAKQGFPGKEFAVGVMLGAFLLPIGKRVVSLIRSINNG